MRGRRRDPRYLASPQWEGALQTLEDVVTERVDDREIWVLSMTPAGRTEAFTLEIATNEGAVSVKVRVTKCDPVLVGGELRHRLRLSIVGEPSNEVAESGSAGQEKTE